MEKGEDMDKTTVEIPGSDTFLVVRPKPLRFLHFLCSLSYLITFLVIETSVSGPKLRVQSLMIEISKSVQCFRSTLR